MRSLIHEGTTKARRDNPRQLLHATGELNRPPRQRKAVGAAERTASNFVTALRAVTKGDSPPLRGRKMGIGDGLRNNPDSKLALVCGTKFGCGATTKNEDSVNGDVAGQEWRSCVGVHRPMNFAGVIRASLDFRAGSFSFRA